jgi:hypothetical protein
MIKALLVSGDAQGRPVDYTPQTPNLPRPGVALAAGRAVHYWVDLCASSDAVGFGVKAVASWFGFRMIFTPAVHKDYCDGEEDLRR